MIECSGFRAKLAEAIETGITFTAQNGGAETAVVKTIGGVEFFQIARGIGLHAAGDFAGEENV